MSDTELDASSLESSVADQDYSHVFTGEDTGEEEEENYSDEDAEASPDPESARDAR